jgi:hypothetical protein
MPEVKALDTIYCAATTGRIVPRIFATVGEAFTDDSLWPRFVAAAERSIPQFLRRDISPESEAGSLEVIRSEQRCPAAHERSVAG